MTDSVGSKTPAGDGDEGVETTTGAGSRAGSIPSTSAQETTRPNTRNRSSVDEELEPVAGSSSNSNQYQAIPTSSNARAGTAQASSVVERQNSTSSNRSEGAGEQPQRRFPFLDFDSSAGPRHIQALNMIQEWARNSMGASIPMLGSSNSNATSSGGVPDNFSTVNERGRPLQLRAGGQNGDTHVQMPVTGGELPLLQSPAPVSNPALSLPSRLARGLLQSSNFRRRSDDIPEPPGE